jgi:peroxiredoxin
VIGMSADNYDALRRFSVEACRNAFPVATASADTIHAYDVRFSEQRPEFTNRTSYVIAPNGQIIYSYSDLDWRNHVTNTLAAVRQWRARQRRG